MPAAALAGLVLLAGCGERNDTALPAADSADVGVAMVRVVNAAPGASSLDIMADDASMFTGVAFKDVTPYRGVNENFVTFRLAMPGMTGDSGDMASNREMMSDGGRYTVVALPGDAAGDQPQLMVLDEPNDLGNADHARIRFVNAAQGLEEFDVFIPGRDDALIDDVNFNSEAGYTDLDPASTGLEVRANDSPRALLQVPSRDWQAGKAYTVIVVGSGQGGGLDAIVLEDQAGAMTTEGGMGRTMDTANTSGTGTGNY